MPDTSKVMRMEFVGSTVSATLFFIGFTQEARAIIKVGLYKFRKTSLEDKITPGQHCHMGLICKREVLLHLH